MVYNLSRSLFIFQLLGECHCWWTRESPRVHVVKFYGPIRLIGSVLRASKLPVIKLMEIFYFFAPSLLASTCFDTFGLSLSNFWNYFAWLRITDEGSVPEMRIWSILWIKSELKCCIHLRESLFIFQLLGEFHCWWTSASPRADVAKFYSRRVNS